jgi:hypothetical protein
MDGYRELIQIIIFLSITLKEQELIQLYLLVDFQE